MWLFETVMGTYILGESLKIYFDFYSFFYVLRLYTQVSVLQRVKDSHFVKSNFRVEHQ